MHLSSRYTSGHQTTPHCTSGHFCVWRVYVSVHAMTLEPCISRSQGAIAHTSPHLSPSLLLFTPSPSSSHHLCNTCPVSGCALGVGERRTLIRRCLHGLPGYRVGLLGYYEHEGTFINKGNYLQCMDLPLPPSGARDPFAVCP